MNIKHCSYCDSEDYRTIKMDYLYKHNDKYLLVPNTPVEICSSCGMSYYSASVLKQIEKQFFAIHSNNERADNYVNIPTKNFEPILKLAA
jgi:YgiT-type zinc finger domain-containing protein